MICPYNQIFSYNEQINIIDNDNPEYFKKHINVSFWKNMDCQKSNCAVWKDGKCHYNE